MKEKDTHKHACFIKIRISPFFDLFAFESKTNTLLCFALLHNPAILKNEMCSQFLEKKIAALQAANSFNVNLQAVQQAEQ